MKEQTTEVDGSVNSTNEAFDGVESAIKGLRTSMTRWTWFLATLIVAVPVLLKWGLQ